MPRAPDPPHLDPIDAVNEAWVLPRNFRLFRGWTQPEAAAWYGVSERTWRRYELNGAPPPAIERIRSYARGAGIWRSLRLL